MSLRVRSSILRLFRHAALLCVAVLFGFMACSVKERDLEALRAMANGGMGGSIGGDGDGDDPGDGDGDDGPGDGDGDIGASCMDADDCQASAPVCEAGECAPCSVDDECESFAGSPYCSGGECVECTSNDDCQALSLPVCGDTGWCRACRAHDECDSLACDLEEGTCIAPENIVYALAGTGVQNDCGTIDAPCLNFSGAFPLLTEARNTLVLVPTTSTFDGQAASLPDVSSITVVGNDVLVAPYTDAPAFVVTGGNTLTLDGANLGTPVICTGSTLNFLRSRITHSDDSATAIDSENCDLTIMESRVVDAANALDAVCNPSDCVGNANTVRIERSWFQGNGGEGYLRADTIIVRNNIFVNNGSPAYSAILNMAANTAGEFSFNTLWGNFNNCIYIGLFNFSDPILGHSNIAWNSFPGESDPSNCWAQVYLYDAPHHSISEITYPGAGNQVADPLFVDPTTDAWDFHLQDGSPAIDAGDPTNPPEVDFLGNPRVVGAGPDVGAIEMQ